jgi:hypothetical protein
MKGKFMFEAFESDCFLKGEKINLDDDYDVTFSLAIFSIEPVMKKGNIIA